MGANSSKTPGRDESDIQPVRRQIGKRSSVNFLSRLDSRSTSTQLPEQTVSHHSAGSSEDSTLYPTTPSSSEETAAESTLNTDSNKGSVFRHRATLSSETQQTVIGPDRKSSSDKAEVADEVDHTAEGAPDEEEEEQDLAEIDESRVATPLARSAPIPMPAPALLLPPTSLLGSESPSKYGFDEVWESAQRMTSPSAKRRTMSGPELFSAAKDLQRSCSSEISPTPHPAPEPALTLLDSRPPHPLPSLPPTTSPPRAYTPRLGKLSPKEFFTKSLYHNQRRRHDSPPENVRNDPRTARLLRKPFPDNLVRDNKVPTDPTRTGLATPLLASQKECRSGHAHWHESSNDISPVECGICLCAGDCQMDTAIFYICEGCALRVCAECKGFHDNGGM
ncbi:hypothetical protein MBLNU457_3547t1 [Dothideomycetes sp. NU457]